MNNEEKILELLGKLSSDVSEMKDRMDSMDSRMDKLDDRQTKMEITMENIIVPRLDALAEGQKLMMETLAPKSRVEALEEEVGMLKSVIRILSSDVAELKRAQ